MKTPIHLFMHIPLEEVGNLADLLGIFKNHTQVAAYAGHTHTQYFRDFDKSDGWHHEEPLNELVAGAVCGAWWLGKKNMYGIPNAMMGDGTPKGYWIMETQGADRLLSYRVSGQTSDKQMHIWMPHQFEIDEAFAESNDIIVNVFCWQRIYAGRNENRR